jgi:hypothetical protein
MICPLEQKVELSRLTLNITLPKAPKRADILFNKYAKTDQYWRRQEVPKGLT